MSFYTIRTYYHIHRNARAKTVKETQPHTNTSIIIPPTHTHTHKHRKIEKDALQQTKGAQKELEAARREAELAQRRGDFARAGELMHAIIPGLERKAGQGAKEGGGRKEVRRMLSEVVTEEHVADIISRATGIPLGSLLQGESDRLLKMEETLKKSVVGQDQAIKAIANCVRCVFPSLFSLPLLHSFLFSFPYRAVLFLIPLSEG